MLLSHDSIIWNSKQTQHNFQSWEMAKEVLVSYLPLSHVAGQFLDVFFALYSAATVYFADRKALKGSLINTLRIARPTRLMGVPRVYEKFQAALQQQTKVSNLKRHLLNWTKYYALQHHMNMAQGQPSKRWQYLLAKKVLNKAKTALGLDRCASLLVGAAPTSMDVKQFFMGFDMVLMECYGLSECGGPSCLNDSTNWRLESVGKTLPGTQLKIANPDESGHGEVLMKGRNIFVGYIGEEEKTREALDEGGWLHTGDIGCVDKEGFVYITGRIKELIITAGGENVPPVHVEGLVLSELPCVSNAVLIGERRKYLTMLITLKVRIGWEQSRAKASERATLTM